MQTEQDVKCRLCGSDIHSTIYRGVIRDGKIGNYTNKAYSMYKCDNCGVVFHDNNDNSNELYETEEYREKMGESAEKSVFDVLHDNDNLEKFRYTGIDVYRNKVVADIGCGGGSFLDFISNTTKETIAIEPTVAFHKALKEKGYRVFSYADDALCEYEGKIDTVVSFDVIEHVYDPIKFIDDTKKLLSENGIAFIGTPTDAPVMRNLLGDTYSSFLFSTQHPWVLNESSFFYIANKLGIKSCECLYFQRYGLNNLFNWIKTGKPRGKEEFEFVTNTADKLWIAELERIHMSDYIVFKFIK